MKSIFIFNFSSFPQVNLQPWCWYLSDVYLSQNRTMLWFLFLRQRSNEVNFCIGVGPTSKDVRPTLLLKCALTVKPTSLCDNKFDSLYGMYGELWYSCDRQILRSGSIYKSSKTFRTLEMSVCTVLQFYSVPSGKLPTSP